jgi:hypothetical protein
MAYTLDLAILKLKGSPVAQGQTGVNKEIQNGGFALNFS